MNNDSFLAANQSASTFSATDFSATTRSALDLNLPKPTSSYAIAAGGLFTDNGGGNFAGDLNNPFDDARIAANGGLTINQWPMGLESGLPIAVGPGAIVPDAVRQRWKVENFAQPVAIAVPAYVEPPIGAFDRRFDVGQLPLNGAADVTRAFGDGQLPSVVHFTGGSLALPSDTVLRNLTIVVEQGDLNFNGDRHLLENVTLIVKDGRVNFGDVRAVNTAVFASDGIDLNQGARFSGKNLLVTQHGDVVFDGATSSAPLAQSLEVIAHGNIYVNGAIDVHGRFLASGSFVVNYDSTVVGSIRAQGGITFNAKVQVSTDVQPLIGIIDTGFNGSNPDIDYSRIILGRDRVDGDDNPLLISGVGNEHGTHVLGIIGATRNNGLGIDGMNDQAPIWLGRAVGSGNWADSLIEFVDVEKRMGQTHAVVNLSFDLTQGDANGRVTTRYELTPQERTALGYARQNGVLIVVPAGNDGGVASVLGQASQEFSNIITVGALGTDDATTPTAYSNRGRGLNIVAYGGDLAHPVTSTVGSGVGSMIGTSVAAAEVTGAASRVWEANPTLNAVQIKDILLRSAIDLGPPGWDALTGSGRLNLEGAIALAQQTSAQPYNPTPYLIPTTWGGAGKATPTERPAGVGLAPVEPITPVPTPVVPVPTPEGGTGTLPSIAIPDLLLPEYDKQKSILGKPIGQAEKSSNGFLKQDFENGYIVWDGQTAITYQVDHDNSSIYNALYQKELLQALQQMTQLPLILGGGPTTWLYFSKYGGEGAKKMLDRYTDLVIQAAQYYGVDGRSIAGAIRWEYEINKPSRERDFYWYYLSRIAGIALGSGVGWGKVHFETAREILKDEGASPSDSDLLSTLALAPSAIDVIGKYMHNAAADYFDIAGVDISAKPEILATLYQTGRIKEKALALAEKRRQDPQAQPQLSDDKTDIDDNPFSENNVDNMGVWLNSHIDELSAFKTVPSKVSTRRLPGAVLPGEPGYIPTLSNQA